MVYSFLKMQTTSSTGGYTVNYAPRFSLSSMSPTAKFSAEAVTEQKKGDTAPPDPVDSMVKAAPDNGPDAAAGQATVPYTKQTGKTRYAPMQTQPGPRITVTVVGPQNPTSSYTVFVTKGPKPNVETTITMAWDYTVTTKINTVGIVLVPPKLFGSNILIV
jgi:hypothetical protein